MVGMVAMVHFMILILVQMVEMDRHSYDSYLDFDIFTDGWDGRRVVAMFLQVQ